MPALPLFGRNAIGWPPTDRIGTEEEEETEDEDEDEDEDQHEGRERDKNNNCYDD